MAERFCDRYFSPEGPARSHQAGVLQIAVHEPERPVYGGDPHGCPKLLPLWVHWLGPSRVIIVPGTPPMKWSGGADEPLALRLPIATAPNDSNKLARPALALDSLIGAPKALETIGTRRVVGPNLRAKPRRVAASTRSFHGLTLRYGNASSWSDRSAAHGQTALDAGEEVLGQRHE
jgi:hypothetical protein